MKIIFRLLLIFPIAGCAQSIELKHSVYFESGKAAISRNETKWIDSVSKVLVASASYKISFGGHCDAVGSSESNVELSKARAYAVKDAFMMRGAGKNISESFNGENAPAAENETETGRAMNRRTEVLISYEPKKAEPAVITEVKQEVEEPKKKTELNGTKLEVGKTLILKNLNFEGGTPILLLESESVLKELLQLMKDNPTLQIEIGGHVCCANDMELSVARAHRVYSYLVGYGVDKKRMTYKGYSRDKPITQERNEQERIMNRRVEITVTKL